MSLGQSKLRELNFDNVYLSGLCPEDSFDEALADMIHDATDDLRNAVIKFFFEKDEAKKVTYRNGFRASENGETSVNREI